MPGMWSFDPVVLGRRETDAWVAYYRHEWRRFLAASLALVREGFDLGRRDTLRGGWLVLRANVAWAPYPDNDAARARELMQRFYTMLARQKRLDLDPLEAARREVEWWRVHRVHQREDALSEDDVTTAVAHLYSYVYGVPEPRVVEAARLRVLAMRLSDQWVEKGCDLADPLLGQERRTLVASYTSLREAIDRASAAAPVAPVSEPATPPR